MQSTGRLNSFSTNPTISTQTLSRPFFFLFIIALYRINLDPAKKPSSSLAVRMVEPGMVHSKGLFKMRMRNFPVYLFSFLILQPGLASVSLQGAEDWSPAAAVEELDSLVVIARLKKNKPADRMTRVRSWLKRLEATELDLGKDAYVKAFALYLVVKKDEGPSANPVPAVTCLAEHIIRHGGLPADAGKKYGGWIDRILPIAVGQALDKKDHARAKALLPTLARHGERGAYGTYSSFGSRLAASEDPADVKLLTELVALAMADESMDGAMKGKLLKYLYSAEPRRPEADRQLRGREAPGSARPASTGEIRFVEFSGRTLDGKEASVRDFRGKVLLIDFWATWCGPCVREMPNVVATYEKYKDKGFAILGVCLDRAGDEEKIRAFMKKQGMDWPQLYDGLGWKNGPGVLNNIRSIPFTFLLDREGRARYSKLRGEALDRRVEELLSGKEAPSVPEELTDDQLAMHEIDELLGVRRRGNLIFCKGNDDGLRKVDLFLGQFKTSPLREKALYLKAISLWGMHRYAEAAPVYGEFLEAWPESDFARIARVREGAAYLFSGQAEKALPKLRAIQKKYPDQPEGYARELASALARTGKIDEARRFMDEVEESMAAAGKSRMLPRLKSVFKKLRVVGGKLKHFEVKEHRSGKTVTPAGFAGKVVLVDFWATWCAPCVAELPHLKKTYEKYREKGFEIFAISLDDDKARFEKKIADAGMEWLHFFDGGKWKNELAVLFDVHSIPASFLLDRDGVIQAVNLRSAAVDDWVGRLLEGKKGAPPSIASSPRLGILPARGKKPARAEPVVSLKAAGSPEMLVLDVAVKGPWHVFGDGAKDGIPLRIEFLEGSGFSASSAPRVPAGKDGVLEGSFRITVPLRKVGPGAKILAELVYQACNAEVCMPPKRLRIDVPAAAVKRKPLAPSKEDDNGLRNKFISRMADHWDQGKTVQGGKLASQLDRKLFEMDCVAGSSRSLPPADIYQRASKSVVMIGTLYKCGRCENWHSGFSSGFVIGSDGVVVTNYHVVEKAADVETLGVMTHNGKVFPVSSVLAADDLQDIAVLQVEGKGLAALPVKAAAPVGSGVYVLGHPDGQFYTFTQGLVSRYMVHNAHGKKGKINRMAITADFARGSSGSPVLDQYGRVVGIVSSTRSIYYNKEKGVEKNLQMVLKHCIPAGELLKLLPSPSTVQAF
jgi:serine protease Do